MRHAGTQARRHEGERRQRAFTLVELLVVIAIIGLLIAAIALVGTHLIAQQRARYSQAILRTVATAIDQFATENPLRQLYNRPGAATFGPYPPYAVDANDLSNPVLRLFPEAASPNPIPDLNTFNDNVLANRLWRDFAGNTVLNSTDYVGAVLFQNEHKFDPANDNRALFTYLAVYGGGVLSQVPPDRLKPLHVGEDEFVNPSGRGTNRGDSGAIAVLGIHDAWDVPIDYFLSVKIEAVPDPNQLHLQNVPPVWSIADRQPVVASRGVSREVFDTYASNPSSARDDLAQWIFSQSLPTPVAAGNLAPGGAYQLLQEDGTLPPGNPQSNGWLRARGRGDAVLPFVP